MELENRNSATRNIGNLTESVLMYARISGEDHRYIVSQALIAFGIDKHYKLSAPGLEGYLAVGDVIVVPTISEQHEGDVSNLIEDARELDDSVINCGEFSPEEARETMLELSCQLKDVYKSQKFPSGDGPIGMLRDSNRHVWYRIRLKQEEEKISESILKESMN